MSTIQLPDDVLKIIGSFLYWDDGFASQYRVVCRAFKFGIDLSARIISLQTPEKLYEIFRRKIYHFGPPRNIPLIFTGIKQNNIIEGSWRLLLRQVFGACDLCDSSSRWMIGCNIKNCKSKICISCFESKNLIKCCEKWYCVADKIHREVKNCIACNKMGCRSCVDKFQSRKYKCNRCNWDYDLALYYDEIMENEEEYAYYNDME